MQEEYKKLLQKIKKLYKDNNLPTTDIEDKLREWTNQHK